jgi:hypothetical protein
MDRFRIVLGILILIISFHLFYKLLERKHNTVEGLTSEFTTDMNAMQLLHSPEIQLPSYKILKVAPRPADISVSATNIYNSNKVRLAQKNNELNNTSYSLRLYNNLSAPSRLKTESELKRPSGSRIKTKPWYMTHIVWNNYNKTWNDYDKLKSDDITRYIRESTNYRSNVRERDRLMTLKNKIQGEIAALNKEITSHEFRVVEKQKEIVKYNSFNDSNEYRNYLLKDLLFKASYNSAFTGKAMKSDMVELVLKRGCRYIDFEVNKVDEKLYVSSDKSLALADALGVINKSLIGNTDPLFINLRLGPNITSEYDFKGQIPLNVRDLLYSQSARKIDNDTRISEVTGKCVIITNRNIPGITNIVSDYKAIGAYVYSEIIQFSGNQISKQLTIVNPDSTHIWFSSSILNWLFGWILDLINYNPNDTDTKYLVTNYKANIIPFQFYKNPKTSEFIFYETIFNNGNCTIIPLRTLDSDYFKKITAAADII